MAEKPTPLAVIVEGIPEALKQRPRWVTWRYQYRQSKWTKVPYMATLPKEASSTDDSTWGTFANALAAYQRGRADGIGFVLGDGWIGFDQDDTLDLSHLQLLNTYTELSPSGQGAHGIARGSKPGPRCRTGQFELYGDGRYFTVTGHRIDGFPAAVEDRTPEIAFLYSRLFGDEPESAKREPATSDAQPLTNENEPETTGPGSADDDDTLIARMAGADNGEKFVRLWHGQWQGMYPSQSEADSALVCMFVFWLGSDTARIDRLFRRSKLMRDKWDAKRGHTTYGGLVINNALRVVSHNQNQRDQGQDQDEIEGYDSRLLRRLGVRL
jgi:putative DNA primase/helicase